MAWGRQHLTSKGKCRLEPWKTEKEKERSKWASPVQHAAHVPLTSWHTKSRFPSLQCPQLSSLLSSAQPLLSRSSVLLLHICPSGLSFPTSSSLLLPFTSQTNMCPLRSTDAEIPIQIKGLTSGRWQIKLTAAETRGPGAKSSGQKKNEGETAESRGWPHMPNATKLYLALRPCLCGDPRPRLF